MTTFRVLLLFLLAPIVTAGLTNQRVYIIGVEDVRYSPHYDHDGPEFIGVSRELFDAFGKAYSIRFEYKILPVAELYSALLNEQTVDFKYPDEHKWSTGLKVGKDIIYSEPCFQYIDGVMVLPKYRGKPITSLGTINGFTPVVFSDDIANNKISLSESSGAGKLLLQVIDGKLDGAYLDIDVANFYLRQVLRRPGLLVWDNSLPFDVGSYKLSTIKHDTIIRQLNRFLVENADMLKEMRKRYGVTEAADNLRKLKERKGE